MQSVYLMLYSWWRSLNFRRILTGNKIWPLWRRKWFLWRIMSWKYSMKCVNSVGMPFVRAGIRMCCTMVRLTVHARIADTNNVILHRIYLKPLQRKTSAFFKNSCAYFKINLLVAVINYCIKLNCKQKRTFKA